VVLLATVASGGGTNLALAAGTPPVVNAVDPHSGVTTGGTQVVIYGSGFSGATGVRFGNTPVNNFFIGQDGAHIFTQSPPGSGVVDVRVINGIGPSAIALADSFTYVPPASPVVEAVDPHQGTSAGGTNVTIYGSGFSKVTTVNFGTQIISCFNGAGGAGGGGAAVPATAMSRALRLERAPYQSQTLAATGPALGPTGAGVGGPGPGFGAPCQIQSDSQMFLNSAPGTAGTTVDITATAMINGSSVNSPAALTDKFTYVSPGLPVLYAIGPNHGTANGGTQVNLFGTGLSGATLVSFGSTTVSSCLRAPQLATRTRTVRVSPSTVIARPLAQAAAGPGPGCFFPSGSDTVVFTQSPSGTASANPVNVTVTVGANTSNGVAYTYDAPVAPRVDAVDPNHGTALGGTTLAGAGFAIYGESLTGATMVNIVHNGTMVAQAPPCNAQNTAQPCFYSLGDSQLSLSGVPPGTANTVDDVTVTVANVTSPANPGDQYTYETPQPPTIYTIDPSHASNAGGTSINVYGVNFTGATDVLIDTSDIKPCPQPNPGTPCFSGGDGYLFFTLPSSATSGATSLTVTTATLPSASTAFTYDAALPPEIDAVSPSSGPNNGGTTLWLSGKNLGNASKVTINGNPTGFFYPNFGLNDVIQLTTPPGATGAANIQVTTGAGAGNQLAFTYTGPLNGTPAVSAVSPNQGHLTGGDEVFVSGSGFDGASSVGVGTATVQNGCPQPNGAACFKIASDNLIDLISPPVGANPGTPVDVTVTVNGNTSAAGTNDKFTYTSTPAPPPSGPYINGLSPNQGPTSGGRFVSVFGGHFTGASSLQLGSGGPIVQNCGGGFNPFGCFNVLTDNQLNFNTPTAPQGTVDVTVFGPGPTNTPSPTTPADLFTVFVPGKPTVDAVSPNTGPTFGNSGNEQVELNGNNLSSVDSVTFHTNPPIVVTFCSNRGGGPSYCFQSFSENTLAIFGLPPTMQAGTVDITAHDTAGDSTLSNADHFTYVVEGPPTVTKVSPGQGLSIGGDTTYISGTNFDGVTQVQFGANSVSNLCCSRFSFGFYSASSTLLVATTPPGPANSTVDVVVSNPSGPSAKNLTAKFGYTPSPLPSISAISPSQGPSEGGTSLYISGRHLAGIYRVQFGGNDSFNFFQQGQDIIFAVSPPASGNVISPTQAPVVVTGAAGPSSGGPSFTYNPTPKPVVKSVAPATGPSEGGSTVFVGGDNIGNVQNVMFGANPGRGVFPAAPNVIEAFSPPGAVSNIPVGVILTTPSGSNSGLTANEQYTYTASPLPAVQSIGPSSGPAGTGVLISGTDLGIANPGAVTFGSQQARGSFNVGPGNGVIMALSPPTTQASPVDVRVTTDGGQSNINVPNDQYGYTAAAGSPVVTVISPNSGAAGQTVYITGDRLGGATAVSFGATPASGFFIHSDNLIETTSPANGSGAVYVQVTTAAGTSDPVSAALYSYPGAAPIVRAALPAMANSAYGGYTTVTYITNLGSAAASVKINYYDTAGAAVGAGDTNTSLAPNASWIVRQDNGHSFASGGAGSGLISSDQPIAAFVNEFAPNNTDATSYTAIPVPDGTGMTLYSPTIVNHAYGSYTTGLGIVNTGNAPTDVTVTYRDQNGTLAKTQPFVGVAAHAYLGVYSGDSGSATDAKLPTGFIGTATITSSGQRLASIVNEVGAGNQFSSFDTVNRGSTKLQAPTALNNAYGGFYTGIAVQDVGGAGGTVAVDYYDQTGALAKAVNNLALKPNGNLGIYQGDAALGPPPSGTGYTATISSAEPIAVIVNEVAPAAANGQLQSTSYNTFSGGRSSLSLPLVESAGTDGWSTSQGIMNTGASPTTVTVTYFDVNTGVQVGTAQSQLLQPNAFWGVYQPAGGLPNTTRASATVSTDGGRIAVICNESNATSFMSYNGQ
jgi:hypothetical protein